MRCIGCIWCIEQHTRHIGSFAHTFLYELALPLTMGFLARREERQSTTLMNPIRFYRFFHSIVNTKRTLSWPALLQPTSLLHSRRRRVRDARLRPSSKHVFFSLSCCLDVLLQFSFSTQTLKKQRRRSLCPSVLSHFHTFTHSQTIRGDQQQPTVCLTEISFHFRCSFLSLSLFLLLDFSSFSPFLGPCACFCFRCESFRSMREQSTVMRIVLACMTLQIHKFLTISNSKTLPAKMWKNAPKICVHRRRWRLQGHYFYGVLI